MILLLDVLLFAAPFVLYFVGRSLTPMLSRAALLFAITAVMAVALTGAWYARRDHMGSGERYAPARIEDGRIVPGHAIPR